MTDQTESQVTIYTNHNSGFSCRNTPNVSWPQVSVGEGPRAPEIKNARIMRLPSQIGIGRQRDGQAFKAIVFDFDGVLADSEPLHFQAFHTVFAEQGVAFTEKDYAEGYVGLSDADCFREVMLASGKSATGPEVDEWVGRKTQFMQHLLRSAHVIIPGIPEFLNEAAEHYRLAIASGARREEVHLVLRRAGLLDVFEQIVTSEDVPRGKPDPGVYLLALALLNDAGPLVGSECLAVEDTPHGIHAAHAAGMKCLAVSTTLGAEALFQADAVVSSLSRFDFPALVERWWPGSYRYGRSGNGTLPSQLLDGHRDELGDDRKIQSLDHSRLRRKHNQPPYREERSG